MAGVGSVANGKLEEPDDSSSNWYCSREEIEKRSPSRLDGIELKRETYFRRSYCTFLQDLGMRLKVPQVTIATAIVLSHRFFLRQSHAKNDKHLVATACLFLASKVEETPRSLRLVILASYEMRHKKDPVAMARINQKETYEKQKELVLVGERLVLITVEFDLNIAHPYRPLVTAIKKLEVAAPEALAQVAWNFVNDGLRTSLCLQFKPHQIAVGAIFLAAKFLKVDLSQDREKVWWQEFDVTLRQLEEVSTQMLELYEQRKTLDPALANGRRSGDPEASSVTEVNCPKGSESVPSEGGPPWNYTKACHRRKAWTEARSSLEDGEIEEELERVIEGDGQAAADAERVKQERRYLTSKSVQKVEHKGGKKESEEDVDSKRRRVSSEENAVTERKWSKSSSERGDRAEGPGAEADRSRAGPSDRAEDGQLPSSSHAHEKARLPRPSDRRLAASGPHEASLKRYRDQHGRRDGHRDGSRVGHGSREQDYQQRESHRRDSHHRTDGGRDRHHYKERDYQEREESISQPFKLQW